MDKRTQSELDTIGKAIDNRIIEFFDSYALVGFIDGQPFILRNADNTKTQLAINYLLITSAQHPIVE